MKTNWYGSLPIKNKTQPFFFITFQLKEKKNTFIYTFADPDPYNNPL